MNAQKVNLDTYSLSLLTAKEDILKPRSSTNWAIFAYDGFTNKLKLADSGAGGVAEMATKFHISKPQYGLCKVVNVETGAPQIAMISWVGQNVEDYRRTECASHIPAIKNFFKEAHVFMSAEKVEDITEEKIKVELSKAQAHAPSQWVRRSSRSNDKEELVGTNYRKTNAAMEMRLINRESFWARAEREEEERKEEERKRTAEERRRLEKERILKERRDAEERDRKMDEKLRMIEEQRRKQAEQEEELRRKEKLKWAQQQREHEEDMRARLKRSESIEKAAEAAVLVSQRSMNPREFFRQLSSSSSQSPTSPGSSHGGKPFRRYQRSLTDTAFIFSKAEESAAFPPRSPLGSDFSRASPSPLYRTMSPPPTSPDFRPVTSPQRPRAPMSPPRSHLHPNPPMSALPGLPKTNEQKAVSGTKSPTEPSAPPASPTLLALLPPNLLKNNLTQLHPEVLPVSPPNIPSQSEHSSFCFESVLAPRVPTAPLPERPNADCSTASHVHTELVSDAGYKVQAILVEEDEEEDERKENETQPESGAVTVGPVETKVKEQKQEEEKKEQQEEEEEKKELEVEKEKEEEEEGAPGPTRSAEAASVEVLQEDEGVKEDGEKNRHSEASQAPAEPGESVDTDAETICQEFKHETVVVPANGMTNGREHNGIERSLSPSDTEPGSPEVAVCFDLRATVEKDDEDNEQEISENGQEILVEQEMCVRALYDYQAEDESEISFGPGDIITDVETVDKAWWRGRTKDGRQGLFPANYVETI